MKDYDDVNPSRIKRKLVCFFIRVPSPRNSITISFGNIEHKVLEEYELEGD